MKRLIPLLFIFIFSCAEEFIADNPLDPQNPEYIPPIFELLSGPNNGEIISTPYVTFDFDGNQSLMEFRTKLDTNAWSFWSDVKTVTFDHLDEGAYQVMFQSRFESGDTSEILLSNFSVDAVTGPALVFFPRRKIASQGSNVIFQILAEEVYNLSAAEYRFTFDPSALQINSVSPGSGFTSLGEVIFIDEVNNSTGSVSISIAVFGEEYPKLSGTADLVFVDVQIIKDGNHLIEFDGSEVFRDHENNPIIINDKINGIIQVE